MMQQYIIMCRSLTYAQRASRLLERAGIFSSITKAPQGATPEGCTYGVRVQEKHFERAAELLKKAGVPTGKIFYLTDGGGAKEVRL